VGVYLEWHIVQRLRLTSYASLELVEYASPDGAEFDIDDEDGDELVMYRYTHEDKTYDVSKLCLEGVRLVLSYWLMCKSVLITFNEVTIAQASAVALHQKMQEYLEDSAIVEDNETEE
jgi:hypothetical protein